MSPKIKLNFTPFQRRICVVSCMYFLWEFRCSPVGKGIMLLFQQNNSEQYSKTTDSQLQNIGQHIALYSVYMYTILGRYLSRECRPTEVFIIHMIKIAWACRASAIWGLGKIYKCLFIPNHTRKIMWLLIKNMHEKILEMVKQKKHTHIMQSGKNCAIQGKHLI